MLLLVLLACTDKTTDSVPVIDDGCDARLSELRPAAEQTDAYVRDPITVTLYGEFTDPAFTVEGVDTPAQIDTVEQPDGTLITRMMIAPEGGLAPETRYEVTASWCDTSESWGFTTSSLGLPLEDPSALSGAVYSLDPDRATVVQPPDLGPVVTQLQTPTTFFAGVTVTGDALRFLMAAEGREGGQDLCEPTSELEASFTPDPFFVLQDSNLDLPIGDRSLELRGLELSGVFRADGSGWEEGTFSAGIEPGSLATVLGFTADAAAFCETLSDIGVPCEACSGSLCVPVEIVDIVAEQVGESVEPVAGWDCHEGCPEADGSGCEAP